MYMAMLKCRRSKNAYNCNDFSGWVLLIQLCFALLRVEPDLLGREDVPLSCPFTLFTSFLLQITPLIRYCHPPLHSLC